MTGVYGFHIYQPKKNNNGKAPPISSMKNAWQVLTI
jgi:hypothetical protein